MAKTTSVYYLGGLFATNEQGEPLPVQYVTALDRAYVLPPIGEVLDLRPEVANDLIRRYTIVGKNGSYVSTFTEDPQIAKLVKNGAYDPFAEQPTTRLVAELGDDEIEREYKRRMALKQVKTIVQSEVPEESEPEVSELVNDEDTVELTDAPTRRGRKPKVEE